MLGSSEDKAVVLNDSLSFLCMLMHLRKKLPRYLKKFTEITAVMY